MGDLLSNSLNPSPERHQTAYETSDFLLGGPSFNPQPVSRGVSNEIPETIQEESESRRESTVDSRRESLDKLRRLSLHTRQFETLVDIAQSSGSSEDSGNGVLSLNDDGSLNGQSESFYNETDCESADVDSAQGGLGSTDEQNARTMPNGQSNSLANNASVPVGNTMNKRNSGKVKPMKSDSFEKAVGFLLESTLKKQQQASIKRVKFDYV
ncbi:hypothetical protein DPMN_112285 [Dreissena polymorpha]|uniref:Uncharacterized protein n=1 Tax=Dreissena polymorpha TaxID=45954 RepID=A0A9D4KFE9_DREPO|nr:hypothetical protein DPMN_112285 [Dreissena polymorpha]